MSVEGEITSKMALLSKLRETLKERQEKMSTMEKERSMLEIQLQEVMDAARQAEEEAAVAAAMAPAAKTEHIRQKQTTHSKKAREQQAALQKRVVQLRRKLETNQRSLRSLKSKHHDETTLEKTISRLKLSKVKLLRQQKLREERHVKTQQRREKELQSLRRDKTKNGRKVTRLQVSFVCFRLNYIENHIGTLE